MKFIINNIVLISIIFIAIIMLLMPILQRRGKHIPPFTVTKKMNEGKVFILDVSKATEFAEGHIKGAMHIPRDELEKNLPRIERYRSETIIIVCPNGTRAAKATSVLKKAGFSDVSSMEGGMKDWKSQSMPIVTSDLNEDAILERPKKGKTKSKKAKA